MWSIKLSDGTTLSGLELAGSTFISQKKITAEMFDGKLSHVTITGPEIDSENPDAAALEGYDWRGEHEHLQLANFWEGKDGYNFALYKPREEELELARLKAQVSYMAMMTGTEME